MGAHGGKSSVARLRVFPVPRPSAAVWWTTVQGARYVPHQAGSDARSRGRVCPVKPVGLQSVQTPCPKRRVEALHVRICRTCCMVTVLPVADSTGVFSIRPGALVTTVPTGVSADDHPQLHRQGRRGRRNLIAAQQRSYRLATASALARSSVGRPPASQQWCQNSARSHAQPPC